MTLRLEVDGGGNMAHAILRLDHGAEGWGEAEGKLDRL